MWDSWHYNAVLVPIAACALLDVMNRWITLGHEAGSADPHLGKSRADEEAARDGGDDPDAPASRTRCGGVNETDAAGLEGGRAGARTPDEADPGGDGTVSSSGVSWRRAAWVAALVPTVSLALTWTSLPLSQLPSLHESPRMSAAEEAIAAVPDGVSVETDTTLLARLVPRREVYWVGTTQAMAEPPQYVLIDDRSYAWGGASVDAQAWAAAAHPGHTYETVYSKQGFRVARRTS